ncbi:hypothetical protein BHM03_00031509 [Ensete ventricosum]|nr:hypothetical protein BHM03_00031509 [Ensete ventricosum]
MEEDQASAWLEAQTIVISENLVAAAERQLVFLAAVDRRRWLYVDGPLLDRAIRRYGLANLYKACWLPLLAKHCECGATDGSLYKGFLHLIKTKRNRSKKLFCVPAYDIDLIWHSHQLHPVTYCNDMIKLLGKVLEHDDTDSDRSKGKKLDVGFNETTKQWEDTYGLRYRKAGTMYRGNCPSPVISDFSSHLEVNETIPYRSQNHLVLPQRMVVEVLLEILGIKNLPDGQHGDLFVSFSKKKPDMLFYGGKLAIQSETGKRDSASFKCETTGELVLALMSKSDSKIDSSMPARTIGTTSIALQDLMNPDSKLSIEKWFELKPQSGTVDPEPVCLFVAVSFTVPVPAPLELRMLKSHPFSTNASFLPLQEKERIKSWTRFLDHNGEEVICLQLRYS